MRIVRLVILLVLVAVAGLAGYVGVQRYERGLPLWPWHGGTETTATATTASAYGVQIDVAGASGANDSPHANYDGGVSISLISISRLPASMMENSTIHPPSRFTAVKVTVGLNSFGPTVPFKGYAGIPGSEGSLALWYGPDRGVADADGGCNTCDAWSELPQQLAGGSGVTLYGSFDVPTADLGNLVVGANPFGAAKYPGVRFTNAQVVLK